MCMVNLIKAEEFKRVEEIYFEHNNGVLDTKIKSRGYYSEKRMSNVSSIYSKLGLRKTEGYL